MRADDPPHDVPARTAVRAADWSTGDVTPDDDMPAEHSPPGEVERHDMTRDDVSTDQGARDDVSTDQVIRHDASVATDPAELSPGDDAVRTPEASASSAAADDAVAAPVDVVGAVEAVLLVTDQPVSSSMLARVLACAVADVETALETLARGYEDRRSGIDLRCVAGGWRLYTRAEFAPYVERFLVDGQQARLTQAALETLAVIAYRQPVTRSRVSAVRGVNVDGVVRTLVARGLVAEVGHDEGSGAALYATTELFLQRLGLRSLDELPSLAPLLPELSELDDDYTSPGE